jgi:hypothetical protein
MRKFSALAALVALCCAGVGVANAGQANIDANGTALSLDASFSPPITSSKSTRQGVTLELHQFYGNVRGNPTPTEGADVNVGLPGGTVFNSAAFAACPLPTDPKQFGVRSRCPAASQVGTGTVQVDARKSGLTDPLNGTVVVYNGAKSGSTPTVILMASLPTPGGGEIITEIDMKVEKGPKLVGYDPLNRPRGSSLYDITRLDLAVGKTVGVKANGKNIKVPFLQAPVVCKKSWAFSLTLVRDSGTQTATDTAPCQKVVG